MNKTTVTILIVVLVLVIAGGILFVLPKHSQAPTDQTATTTTTSADNTTGNTVLYAAPENLADYIKAEDKYSSEGGTNPALTWPFDAKQVVVPEGSTSEAYAVEVAANQVGTGGGPGRIVVTHFKIVGDTAYVLTNIDEDAWAGVSFAQNKVRPLIEKTLLLNPAIKKVVVGMPPQIKASGSLQ